MSTVLGYIVAFGTLIGIAVGILFGARSSSREAARMRREDTDRKVKAVEDPLRETIAERDRTIDAKDRELERLRGTKDREIEWLRDRVSSLEDQLRGGFGDERLNRPRPR